MRKNEHRFGNFRISQIFDGCFTQFKNIQILLYKISHRFLATIGGETSSLSKCEQL